MRTAIELVSLALAFAAGYWLGFTNGARTSIQRFRDFTGS